MKILITGASGLLGINLAYEAAKEHTVSGVVHHHPLQTDAFRVVKADLLEQDAVERVLDETQPDWVIHCAALADLDACEREPGLARELNSELPQKLAAYVGRGGARLLHVSTDAVFDGRRGDYTEEDAPNPINVYAATKLDGERAVAEANPDAIIARVNLFGWSLLGNRSLAEFFFYNLQAGRDLKGFTDVYFCPLLANDLAHIFLKLLRNGHSGLYHVVSGECITKYDFGVAIALKFGFSPGLITPKSVKDSDLQAARASKLTLRVDKLVHDLGVRPPELSPSLDKFYTLYQQSYPQKLRRMVDQG